MPDTNITKNALATSLKKLMKTKSFSKISVTDICEACGMNRKSFYYHFRDKYDLANWIFQIGFMKRICVEDYSDGWKLLEDMCCFFYEDHEFYINIMQVEGQNSFKEYFSEVLHPVICFFVQDILDDPTDQEFLTVFFCDAFLMAIMRWLSEGIQYKPEQFLKHLHNILNGTASYIVSKSN